MTRIAVWNGGHKTIRAKEDIADISPIRIHLCKSTVLSRNPQLIYIHKSETGLRIKKSKNKLKKLISQVFTFSDNYKTLLDDRDVIFDFQYLEKNQGCIVEIVHDGDLDSDPQLLGEIIEGKIYKFRKNLKYFQNSEKSIDRLIKYGTFGEKLLGISLFLISFIPKFFLFNLNFIFVILIFPLSIFIIVVFGYLNFKLVELYFYLLTIPRWIFRFNNLKSKPNETKNKAKVI